MTDTLIHKDKYSLIPKGSTAIASILLTLGFHSSFVNIPEDFKPHYNPPSKYSWEQTLVTEYSIPNFQLPATSLIPSELKDQPNYSYNEMIKISKELNLPTEFPI